MSEDDQWLAVLHQGRRKLGHQLLAAGHGQSARSRLEPPAGRGLSVVAKGCERRRVQRRRPQLHHPLRKRSAAACRGLLVADDVRFQLLLRARDGRIREAAGRVEETEDRERLDSDPEGFCQLRHRLRHPRRNRHGWTRRNLAARCGVSDGFHRRRRQVARWRHVLHFDKGQTPPTNTTWSVSMYDPEGYYVPNAISRYNLAPWMPLKFNADGSLDLYIQATSPGADKEANWLPAPSSGQFNLTVRIFWPTEAVLDGTYKLPPVRKLP